MVGAELLWGAVPELRGSQLHPNPTCQWESHRELFRRPSSPGCRRAVVVDYGAGWGPWCLTGPQGPILWEELAEKAELNLLILTSERNGRRNRMGLSNSYWGKRDGCQRGHGPDHSRVRVLQSNRANGMCVCTCTYV